MKAANVKIRGLKPLLMHNERLANPLDKCAIDLAEVAKKRNKTIDDHRLLSKLEFIGGIYHSDNSGPYVPSKWVLKMIQEGATREKLGKAMVSAVFIENEELPLLYDGPKQVDKLYDQKFYDQRCIGVNRSKTVRTRPRFDSWALSFDLLYDETIVDPVHIRRAIEYGGKVKGIGDYRPRFGTFWLEGFDE